MIQGYVVRYSLGAGSPWIKQVRMSPSVTFYLMRDLKSSTTYYVDLQAINKYFTSEPSVVEVTTQESGRSAIYNLHHAMSYLRVRYTVIEINSELVCVPYYAAFSAKKKSHQPLFMCCNQLERIVDQSGHKFGAHKLFHLFRG